MSAFANKRSNDGGEEEPSSKSQKTVGSSLDDVDVKVSKNSLNVALLRCLL